MSTDFEFQKEEGEKQFEKFQVKRLGKLSNPRFYEEFKNFGVYDKKCDSLLVQSTPLLSESYGTKYCNCKICKIKAYNSWNKKDKQDRKNYFKRKLRSMAQKGNQSIIHQYNKEQFYLQEIEHTLEEENSTDMESEDSQN